MDTEEAIRILTVDLTKRAAVVEELPGSIVRHYIGGRGLGAHLLYQRVPAKADPLGAENHVIFTAGPMSGTGFFYSSKSNVSTKSPLTGIYLFSICSGLLAQEIRKSGLWAIDITGVSPSPVYLMIKDGVVEFREAGALWGLETAAAQKQMLGDLPANRTATVGIGPAGEQLVPFAAAYVSGDLYRCFGRGGVGCVMGSKRLKGLVVTGSGEVAVAHPDRLKQARQMLMSRIKTDFSDWARHHSRYETAADLEWTNEIGILPTRNWQNGQFEGWRGIDKSTTPLGWPVKARPCAPYCPTAGTREVVIQEGPYKGAHSDVEWETVYAFGSQCGVDRMDAVIAASQMCDEFGVDTMTAGVTIGFAMECFEKGLIGLTETEGIELRFGNEQAMLAMLGKLIRREGFGKELAKGSRALSKLIPGSEGFAMQSKGLEFGGYECRGLNGQALQFAIGARGGCHHAYGLPARAESLDGSRLNVEGKGIQVKNAAIGRILADSLILCTFPGPVYTREIFSEALSSLFTEPITVAELNEAGERIMCQERLFNMREGLTRADDTLPKRLTEEPKPDGPTQGATVPLEALKDQFYQALGYDLATGNPTAETLARLKIAR